MKYFKFQLSYDINGNKIVKIKKVGYRGFSIQTNGSLPETHRMDKKYINKQVVFDEVKTYVLNYGTENQKAMF